MSLASYRTVLRAPGVSWLMATSMVARLPAAMANLAIILRVAGGTGSYARAGAVTAAYVVGTGLMGPVVGRLADHLGRRPVLLVAAVVNASGLTALALVPVHRTLVLLIVGAIAGASLPPVAPAVRSLWSGLVGSDLQSNLYALDATLQESTFMVGPTMVALISAIWNAQAALVVCGVIGLAGTLALTRHPAVHSPAASADSPPEEPVAPDSSSPVPRPTRRGLGRLLQPAGLPGLGTLVIIITAFLGAILMVEVTVVAFASHSGAKGQAGLLLATWATGSMTGGLLFGTRAAQASQRVLGGLLAVSALGFLALTTAPGVGVLYGLLFLAGMAIAPGFSAIYELVGRLAPSNSGVEAFSWIASGIQLGAAGGAALGGLLVEDVGTRWTFVVAAGIGLGTAGIAWRRTRRDASPSSRRR